MFPQCFCMPELDPDWNSNMSLPSSGHTSYTMNGRNLVLCGSICIQHFIYQKLVNLTSAHSLVLKQLSRRRARLYSTLLSPIISYFYYKASVLITV